MQKRMAGLLAIAALTVGAADVVQAAGTIAGTNISNVATVNYSVNSVAQPAINANADFLVDRRVDLTLTAVLVTYLDVTPGTAGNAIPFDLTNTSNAALNFNLAASNVANPFAPPVDNFDPTVNAVFVDDGDNVYDAGDTATVVDTLAPDTTIRVYVVSTIPGGQAGGSVAGVAMTATARETTANGGGPLAEDAGADVANNMETVFGDGAGPFDIARDAAFSEDGAFRVLGATVTVTKVEDVLEDPVNGISPNAKHIPGAIVEYTVTVTNDVSATANADAITLTDVMPANVLFNLDTYGLGQGIQVGGAPRTNTNGDADGADFTGNTVTVTIPTLAAGASTVITFQVTVQ